MKTFEIEIKNVTGLHARPASMLVKSALRFNAQIYFIHNNARCNCKSIMSVLAGSINQGDLLKFEIIGNDEEIAASEIKRFLEIDIHNY